MYYNSEMSKKKTIIVIALAVIIIIIVGVIGFDNKVAKAPETSGGATPTSTATQTTSTTTSTSTAPAISVVLSTSTSRSYTGSSFSFKYPGSWTIFSTTPLMITSFNGQYKAGGVIPAGGVQIAVVTTTISNNLNSIMTTELANAIHLTTSTVMVNGTSCAKATYQVKYAPGATVQNVSVYCSHDTELWKIYFSYPANDPAGQADTSDFNGILGSMKLL